MIVHLTPVQEERLQQLATQAGRTADDLAIEQMDRYLDHVDSLAAALREGEESAEHEGWLTHEEVFERINKRLLKTA